MRSTKLSVLAITLLLACAAWASEVGSISGVVTDPTGAAVVKATVVIRNVATGVTTSVTTNEAGAYSFLALPVGRYDLTVSATGFEKYQETGIVLNTNDQLRHDVALKIGAVTNTVEVAANALHVETANTQLGDVISGTQMENIPLNGREYTDLLSLQPGVAPSESAQTGSYNQYFGTTETGSISVSGQRETSNGFFVNGANVNDTLNNGTTVVPNLDSIAEFRILTANFDAEYGNYSGGLVTVVTKSGTNALHGDAFDYIRNTGLDARGFFDSTVPAFVQNQFGGTLGGPIRHDKVFFFTDYQGTRSDVGQSFGAIPVPTTTEQQGNFSALASDMTGTVGGSYFAGILSNELGYPVTAGEPYYTAGCTSSAACVFPNAMIPASAISAPAQALLKYIPTPMSGSTFVSNADTEHTRDDLFSGRIDYNSASLGTISGYYFFDDQTIHIPFGTNNIPGFPTLNGGRSQLFTISDTKSIGPDALNELHLSFNRHVYHNGQPLAGLATLSSLGFNENQPGGIVSEAGTEEGVPSIDFNNFTIGNPIVAYNRYENVPSVSDNFSKVIGTHSIKFGALYMFDDFIEPIPLAVANGLFVFSGGETGIDFADFLIGAPTAFVQEAGFDYHNLRNYL
ncbi:MAG: carboxypeptidase-like regulatory domain-containing protein, partial [Candidatus Acidiferrales bacterium]